MNSDTLIKTAFAVIGLILLVSGLYLGINGIPDGYGKGSFANMIPGLMVLLGFTMLLIALGVHKKGASIFFRDVFANNEKEFEHRMRETPIFTAVLTVFGFIFFSSGSLFMLSQIVHQMSPFDIVVTQAQIQNHLERNLKKWTKGENTQSAIVPKILFRSATVRIADNLTQIVFDADMISPEGKIVYFTTPVDGALRMAASGVFFDASSANVTELASDRSVSDVAIKAASRIAIQAFLRNPVYSTTFDEEYLMSTKTENGQVVFTAYTGLATLVMEFVIALPFLGLALGAAFGIFEIFMNSGSGSRRARSA